MKQKTEFKETELGRIPKKWEIKKINLLFEIKAGGDLRKLSFSKTKNNQFKYPIFSNSLNNKGLYGYSNNYKYKSECVTITARGEVGRAECRKENFNAIVRLLILKPKIEISCYFVSNFINSKLDFQHVGSAVNQLTAPMISNFKIAIPPLQEQKAISKILSDLDEKIEINRKINKNLEELGQALFKRWFIDLEFPNEDGKPYKSSGGEMIRSELGEIPKGWKVGKLKENSKIICGKTPLKSVKENFGNNIPFIKIPDMHNNTFIINTSEKLTEKGNLTQKNKLIPKGSINVSCIATVGLVTITSQPSHTNQQINSLIVNNIEYKYFLYFQLINLKKQLQDMGSGGSATLNVNTNSFSNIKIIYPNNEVLMKFHNLISPFFNQIKKNSFEIQSLQQIRDSLLPKLMSGQLRVNYLNK